MLGKVENAGIKESCNGIYEERINMQKKATEEMPPTQESVSRSSGANADIRPDEVIFSQEAKEYMEGVKQRKEAAKEEELKRQEEILVMQSDNEFENSLSLNSQSQIFSKLLHDSGYFDGLSDEQIKETEELLASITSGMDSLNSEKDNCGMSSSIAMADLESSAGALRYFCDKYVPESKKEEFGKLIDNYYSFNQKNTEAHVSLRERFDVLKKNLPPSNIANPNQKQSAAIASDNVSKILGNVTHSEEDKKNLKEAYASEISKVAKGELSIEDFVKNMRELSNAYSSGSSKNSNVIDMLEFRNGNYFKNLGNYWNKLI